MSERKIKPKLVVCVPAKSDICAVTTACITNILESKLIRENMDLSVNFAIGQSDLPKIRSNQLTMWYDGANPGDFFLFIDADQIFTTSDVIQAVVLGEEHDVVCASYAKKTGGMTVQPIKPVAFYRDLQGSLFYGATGFMLIRYHIVERLVREGIGIFGTPLPKYVTGRDVEAYPFFFERTVKEHDKEIWLSEDYSFCANVREIGGSVYGFISKSLGHIIPVEKYVHIPYVHSWPEKSIVYYCSKQMEPWSPKSLENGIGGSETAVIRLSPEWVKAGYSVTVFCHCNAPGVYDGVVYRREEEFNFVDKFDIIIAWRSLKFFKDLDVNARLKIVDLHDDIKPSRLTPDILENVDLFMIKSKYHGKHFPESVKEKLRVIPNGGKIEEKERKNNKDPNSVIYTSSYDRGLAFMLKYGWPMVRKACPEATLNLYYGWNGYDAYNETKERREYKKMCLELMDQPGVRDHGRVSQEVLKEIRRKSMVHYYVGDFQEIDCISVRESASVGCIPVVSDEVEVFREKGYVIRVGGDPTRRETQELGAQQVIKLLSGCGVITGEVPEEESWEKVAQAWLKNF